MPEVKVIARWWDRVMALLFVVNLAWVTWQLGGFVPGPMVVALPLVFILAAMAALRWWLIAPSGAPVGWWYPVPFLGWVAVHMAGLAELPSRGWLHGWHLWSALAAYWVALHLVRRPQLWRAMWAAIGVVALGVVIAGVYQRLGDATWLPLGREQVRQFLGRSSGTFGNPNNAAAWLALVLPVAAATVWRGGDSLTRAERWFAGVVALACALGIILSFSRGVFLTLVIATGLATLARRKWSWLHRLGLMAGIFAGAIGLVWVGYQTVPEVRQRVDTMIKFKGERTRPLLWGIAAELWQERPLTGHGGGSFEMLMERHRPEGLWESARFAHNDYLNTLSDYGGVGVGLGLIGVVLVVRRRWQRQSRPYAGAGLGLLILSGALAFDFHLQSPAVLWLAAMLVGGWAGSTQARRFPSDKQSFGAVSGAVICLALVVLPLALAVPRYQAEELRWRARAALNQLDGVTDPAQIDGIAQQAGRQLGRAISRDPGNERAWMDYSYALSLQKFGNVDAEREQGRQAEFAARRALEGSELVAEHWLRLGMALQLQGDWAAAGPAFGRAVRLAPRQPVMWYYQGHHFSLRPPTHALAKAALAICLRLDPGNDAAKLLKAELERSP